MIFKIIQFNNITLDFKHLIYKSNGFSPSIQPIPRFYFLRFSVYDMAGTNVPWHIRASRAVACDNLQLRASAHHWHKKRPPHLCGDLQKTIPFFIFNYSSLSSSSLSTILSASSSSAGSLKSSSARSISSSSSTSVFSLIER